MTGKPSNLGEQKSPQWGQVIFYRRWKNEGGHKKVRAEVRDNL